MSAEHDAAARRCWELMNGLTLDADRRKAVTQALGISFARSRLLRRLLDEPRTLRELSAALGSDPPYTTLIVADLESRGLVARVPHPTDGRAKLVRLTPAGRRAAREAAAILAQPPEGLRALDADDLAALERILERVTHPAP